MAQNPPTSDVNSALDNLAFGIANAGSSAPTPVSLGFNTAGENNAPPVTSQDVLNVAAAQTNLLKGFYNDVLNQSRTSFLAALTAAICGFIIFVVGLYLLYTGGSGSGLITVGTIGTVAGIIIQIVSSLLFYLYARTSTQLGSFHNRLLRVQRFLLANQICDSIADSAKKDDSRAALIAVIAGAIADADVPDAPLPQRPTGMLPLAYCG